MKKLGWFLVFFLGFLSFCARDKEKEILYKVGSGAVTVEDIKRTYLLLPPSIKMRYRGEAGKRALLENLLSLELLYQEALRQKIDQDPMVQFRIERARKHLLVEELVERTLSPEDLYSYYQENFIHLDGIYFEVKDLENKREWERARARAERVYQLLTQGKDFKELKARYNPEHKDQELGFFSREGMIQLFGEESASQVFSLGEEEKFTKPIKTSRGWAIFYVLERPGNLDPKGYQEVWEEILSRKREEIFRGLINEVRSRIPVKEYSENIERFLSEGQAPSPPAPEKEAPLPEKPEEADTQSSQ